MLKKLFVGLVGLIGITLSADNSIRLLSTETIKEENGKVLDVKYYCKEGKVFIHIYGIVDAKDNRIIMPVVWENTRNNDRVDPQVLCSEFKDWIAETK